MKLVKLVTVWLSSRNLLYLSSFSFQTLSLNYLEKKLNNSWCGIASFSISLAGSWPPWAPASATCSQSFQESLRTSSARTASQHHRALPGAADCQHHCWSCWALWLPSWHCYHLHIPRDLWWCMYGCGGERGRGSVGIQSLLTLYSLFRSSKVILWRYQKKKIPFHSVFRIYSLHKARLGWKPDLGNRYYDKLRILW